MSVLERLQRTALSPGHNLLSDDLVQELVNSKRPELLDGKRYRRYNLSGLNVGSHGSFGHQLAGVGVQQPMLYFAEVHAFKNLETGEWTTVVVTVQVDEDGAVVPSTGDAQIFDNTNAVAGAQKIAKGEVVERTKDGRLATFGFGTLEEAQAAAQAAVKQFAQNVLK